MYRQKHRFLKHNLRLSRCCCFGPTAYPYPRTNVTSIKIFHIVIRGVWGAQPPKKSSQQEKYILLSMNIVFLGGCAPQTPHYHNVKDRYMRHVLLRVGNCHLSVKTTAENPTQCTCGSVCLSFGGIFGGIFVNRRLFSYSAAFLAAFLAALLVAANNL